MAHVERQWSADARQQDARRPLHRLCALRRPLVRAGRQQDHCAECAPPTRFPYLVFLVRTDGRRMLRGKQAPYGHARRSYARTTAAARMLLCVQPRLPAPLSGPPVSKRPRVRDRSGRINQDRSSRQQDRSGQTARPVVANSKTALDATTNASSATGAHTAQATTATTPAATHFNNLDNPYKTLRRQLGAPAVTDARRICARVVSQRAEPSVTSAMPPLPRHCFPQA